MQKPKQPSVDETLDAKTIAQLTWKPSVTCNTAIAIVRHFLKDRICYTDDIDLQFVPDADKNCIGLTFRRLREQGIISETGRFRRNDPKKRPDRRGGKAFQYRLVSERRAVTFCERNGWTPGIVKGQTEMFQEVAKQIKKRCCT